MHHWLRGMGALPTETVEERSPCGTSCSQAHDKLAMPLGPLQKDRRLPI